MLHFGVKLGNLGVVLKTRAPRHQCRPRFVQKGEGWFLWVKHSNRIKPRFVVENLAAGHFQKLQVPRGRQAAVDTPGKPIQC